MKNNKKKANKEKRVMAAALCITAVAVAGSTFAWFTSTDEVTNRLSANADYDVSIVESFTPPANWIPGQKINKDVYAINTGSISAFVNEDVSGVLTYTVENKTATRDDNCVKLTEDEVDIIKAGAYLAGAFQEDGTSLNQSGNIAEYFNNGAGTDPLTTDDFTPTTAGLYFFRRAITVNSTDQSETFDYAGYYYDGNGNYYKFASIGINELPQGTAGDGITTDGNLTKCPTVLYAKEETKTVTPTLKYEAAVTSGEGQHPARLVARYNTGGTGATAAQALAVDNADKAVTGENGALKALNAAKAALDTAEAAYQTAVGANNAALTTIAYYAGDTNKATIEKITNFTYVGSSTAIGSASSLTNADIASPGVLYQEIVDYNDLVTQFNGLQTQITTAESNQATANTNLGTKNTAVTTAQGEFDNAKAAYTASLPGHTYDGDIATIGTPSTSDAIYVCWQKEQALKEAQAAQAAAQTAYDDATNALNDLNNQAASLREQLIALGNTIKTNVTALNNAIDNRDTNAENAAGNGTVDYDDTKAAYEDALAAYETALATYNAARAEYETADNTGSDLVIYINLSDDVVTSTTVKDKWQLIPIVSGADGDDTVAHFYYTGILQGAESSAKLIDSVELADSVTQDTYKNFDFDLNIHLDSAQVAYADDQKTIKADAATGTAFENKKANLTAPTNIETSVLWS